MPRYADHLKHPVTVEFYPTSEATTLTPKTILNGVLADVDEDALTIRVDPPTTIPPTMPFPNGTIPIALIVTAYCKKCKQRF